MHRISKIELKHFKFFHGLQEFDLDSKNLILYGENGSGKSSIYWALYTFLQSSFKPNDQDIKKYFDVSSDENLVNRFAPAGQESAIVIEFKDESSTVVRKQISYTLINTKSGDLIKEAAGSSDFINYRMLSRLYDFSNKSEIDLFPLFEREVLMFISFTREFQAGNRNAADWWEYVKKGMQPRTRITDAAYADFQTRVTEFNEELETYLLKIIEGANEYLQNKFKQNLKLILTYNRATYNTFEEGSTTKRNHRTIPPQIILTLEYLHEGLNEDRKAIRRPQSFLNEARLTSIALSIRFAILDEKYIENASKILVLDDLLISLDMSNRDIVLELIIKEFSDYQIIILTHDRMFFELAKHKVNRLNQANWTYYEMYESVKDNIPQPFITKSGSYLEKAKTFFHLKEYEVAGNFLRKQAEAFCRDFLPKRKHYTTEYEPYDLNGLINQCIKYSKENELDSTIFEDLGGHRKFVLNPTSHDSYDIAKFNHEVSKCIDTFDKLKQIQFSERFEKEKKLEFELVSVDNADTYKFEITLLEPMVLIKQPGSESVLSKATIRYVVTKNGTPTQPEPQYSPESLKSFYSKMYEKSNKAKSIDFWEEISLVDTGGKLRELRIY
jgi:hypothetical protein